nr:zinc finger, CCHC-type [Tanacetum cinerariifolium]
MWYLFDLTPFAWCKTDAHSVRLHLFQFSLRDQASSWLKRLPAGSITTWEDLTTRFLAYLFPPGRTAKLRNDILMFQQHQGESRSEAWNRFKDLLQKYCLEDPEQAFVKYASSHTDKVGDVEEPLDLVDISEESVYESLINEMPKCSLNYDFKIKKGHPRNLKIPCMIGCRKPSDLEEGFYRDTIKLGPEYVTKWMMKEKSLAGDGVARIRRRRRDLSSDGIRNMEMTSGHGQLIEYLESSTQPNETNMNDLESDDELVDTPLVSPFPHSYNYSGDGEVLNELKVLLGKPFRKITKLKYDVTKGLVSFTKVFDTYIFRMPCTIHRLGNFKWSKISPLLELSQRDLMNGLRYPYEKNKLMYKNYLNLHPEYQVDESMKEWLMHGYQFHTGNNLNLSCAGIFSKKSKRKFFLVPGDDIRIYPDGVVSSATGIFENFQVIFDEKKLGSS